MHWADVVASRLDPNIGHRIATGITPSGHIHVGNMREILTGDLVHRAAVDRGLDSTLHYLADDFDPLRKVYPFLPPSYSEHVGKPLSEIPSPDGTDRSYADYFLEPFIGSLDRLGVKPVVLKSSESYKNGRYSDAAMTILDKRVRVREILSRIAGRDLPEEYIPYTPKCSSCGRLSSTTPLKWERPHVLYRCSCGHEGRSDVRTDDGKLPWRLDWPARWSWLGVTVEPFGKDHAASGGSYDTASLISREVLGREPPFPIVYEWIQLKGKGAMHSSTGVVVTGAEMLNIAPPEVLRFFIARSQPSRHLDMDPGLGILTLVDDFDKYEEEYLRRDTSTQDVEDSVRTYQLSLTHPSEDMKVHPDMVKVPYRHLVTLVQISSDQGILREKILRAEGIREMDDISWENIQHRMDCVRFWLSRFAPEEVKFSLTDEVTPGMVDRLDPDQMKALPLLRGAFADIKWDADDIHNAIYDVTRKNGVDPRSAFKAVYRVTLDSERGPRLGFFLATLDRENLLDRIDRALALKGNQSGLT